MQNKPFNEKEYIINSFKTHFSDMRDHKIAIYGIGRNTKIVLDNFDASNIVGIMDEARTGDIIHGQNVISLDEMVEFGTEIVIIIARAGNIKIIYRRIADVCMANRIEVYTINGKKVCFEADEKKSFDKYWDIKAEVLARKIENAEVVSFDVFDTLIMRKVLYPHDIFCLIEKEVGNGFARKRIAAEAKLLNDGIHPTVYDIYAEMGEFSPETEIRFEMEYLVKRDSICEMLDYAVERGKEVYIVSDMYLTGDIIDRILRSLGINSKYKDILVSCDYKTSKHDGGLFGILREKAGDRKILHIGDNIECDIEHARANGIDDTFHIESAGNMLEDSYAAHILNCGNSLERHIVIGEFISRRLNDPFLFGRTNGKFEVNSNYEMARSFIAPLLYLFFAWLVKKSKELEIDLILLPSRDGYIFQKMYEVFKNRGIEITEMRYFYISRAAAVIAGIVDDDDILDVARLEYAGDLKDVLKRRFHLRDDEISEQGDVNSDDYILLHRKAIMRNVKAARGNYLKYIAGFNIPADKTVGFMDFIAVGHCQKYLSNIVQFGLHGLYFSTYNCKTDAVDAAGSKWKITVDSLMEVRNCFQFENNFFEMQFLLELVLTSFESTLSYFNNDGEPVFFGETRSKKQLADLKDIFNGIIDYAKDTKLQAGDLPAEDFTVFDSVLSLIKTKYSVINTDYFSNVKMQDPFNNREFEYQL